jgi:hypothetical protein
VTIGVVSGVHELRQALAENLILVEARLEEVIPLVQEEPAVRCGFSRMQTPRGCINLFKVAGILMFHLLTQDWCRVCNAHMEY